MAGLLIAAWKSHDALIHSGATIVLVAPVSMVPVFLWTQFFVPRHEPTKEPIANTPDDADPADVLIRNAEEGKAARFRK